MNRRAVLASVTIGNGLSALQSFCADLNMPTPMSQHTFEYHLSAVKLAAEETAKQSLSRATKELHEHLKAPLNEVVNCRTMFDGSWRKRGHSSLQGTVACISTDTGKVLDYEALNKVCHKCSRFSNTDSVAYQTFIANHTCKTNYEGSAASMEPTGIKRIYKRSIEQNNLRYTEYLGDGDSSSFNSVAKDEPYGPDVPIKKLECVGHVQKRLGTALRKLKTTKSRTPLADGKSIGGRG